MSAVTAARDAGGRFGPVVTFDLFSALIDSRSGASALLDEMATARRWPVTGPVVHERWDTLNKAAQAAVAGGGRWRSFRDLSGDALAGVYTELGLRGDPRSDGDALLDSVSTWPLWPDVADALPGLAAQHPLGILSNVDDDVFARTRIADLVDAGAVLTSQRLQAYKPGPRIYAEARRRLGPMVHVATSARDVRGALEAGCPTVRMRRPGHALDREGPRPENEVGSVDELSELLAAG